MKKLLALLLLTVSFTASAQHFHPHNNWQHRYYYGLCSIDSRNKDFDNNIKLLCINYLETLQWFLNYYYLIVV